MSAADVSALVIAMREGIEMALVVGIVLAYLTHVGARAAQRWVWLGAGAATLVSLGFLGILNALDAEFEGQTEQLFEGVTMVLAAIFLTWMIFWMLRNARHLKGELQRAVQGVLDRGGMAWGIFLLVFFAVVREGVELALLLFAAPGEGKLLGSVLGLAVAVGVGVLIYAFGRRIDLRTFFKVTTIILVLFAAGLIAHAAHEFAEAGLLAAVEGPKLWTTRGVLPDDAGFGAILRALVGYQDEPTVIEVVAYLGYFVVVWVLSRTRMATAPITAKAPRAA
ncbi:MAG TPA: FTR1 family protein [Candidatus Limnocylindria bacterium]|jgi:high-affinity iron transporter|nr:FTR1 family protein [Candidatus Limnocylindria bacterium]